jgi:hypothetical protein
MSVFLVCSLAGRLARRIGFAMTSPSLHRMQQKLGCVHKCDPTVAGSQYTGRGLQLAAGTLSPSWCPAAAIETI